jgi:quercetin dioxygenase-like cupin family protein
MSKIPADDPERSLTFSRADSPDVRHVGVAGGTYSILVTGKDTAGRFCLIDLHIPPGGGPPPHRHDFEELFTILEGEIEATFRGKQITVRAGETINIPANAPHTFQNKSDQAARILCTASPAGLDEFFLEVGIPLATRTSVPPKPGKAQQEAFKAKINDLSAKYKMELLEHA